MLLRLFNLQLCPKPPKVRTPAGAIHHSPIEVRLNAELKRAQLSDVLSAISYLVGVVNLTAEAKRGTDELKIQPLRKLLLKNKPN